MNDYKGSDQYKGWLYKWTNYLRGYQKRWFVVQNGLLSYYRNQAEMSHTCRGTINLTNATIDTYDSCTFVISNSGNQTFHLRTYSELEMKRWVTALSLAKAKAISLQEADDDSDMNMDEASIHANGGFNRKTKAGGTKEEVDEVVHTINRKLEDLSSCEPLLERHGDSLFKALNELEHIHDQGEVAQRIRIINEKAVHFRVASSAMINACTEFGRYVSDHAKKWQRMLQYEHDQRIRLEAMVEELAKQHRALEKKVELTTHQSIAPSTSTSLARSPPTALHSGDSDDDDFFDALDEPEAAFSISLSRPPHEHGDTASASGPQSTDAKDEYRHEYESSDDSDLEQGTEIRVIAKQHRHGHKDHDPTRAVSGAGEKGHKRSQSSESTASRKSTNSHNSVGLMRRKRRAAIPDRPNYSVNLWSIMKNCIGKELTKIPMPVNFSEPLSMLQRLSEDFEYSSCLDKAVRCSDPIEQMAYVAAYTAAAYSTTTVRTGKPFNPLLGETFEMDRTEDMGWRSIAEQVSHHPPTAALHCESAEWETWQEFTASSKFRGKYLAICPLGIAHLVFKNSSAHYTWRKVSTTVHNIIVGRLWIDNHGEMDIINHDTGEKCHLVYKPYSYFSRDSHRRVNGVIYNAAGEAKYVLNGTWDEYLEGAHVLSSSVCSRGKPVLETGPTKVLWRRNPTLPGSERMYNFTKFAIEMNEMEEGTAPSDSRLRPDQRCMENGDWDEANKEKVRLEEKQRAKRRIREKEEAEYLAAGRKFPPYEPVWFKQNVDSITGNPIHIYNKKYWECKRNQHWSDCPDLY